MDVKENVQQVEVLHRRKGALSLLNPMFLLQKQSQSNSLNARMQQSMSELRCWYRSFHECHTMNLSFRSELCQPKPFGAAHRTNESRRTAFAGGGTYSP